MIGIAVHDIAKIRSLFPALHQKVNGKPLIYFDNAATSQKPQEVIDAISEFYQTSNSNVHRGIHALSDRATRAYEGARESVRQLLNAEKTEEIIFTRGTTSGINLVASSFCQAFLSAGDEILLTQMEHHSNIVPWQIAASRTGAKIKVLPVSESGELIMEKLDDLLSDRTKIISVVHTSNSLGTVNPVKEIIKKAHKRGIPVLLDGAQAVPHRKTDVRDLDCDFFVFSAHKAFGPTGTGVLYGKEKWLNQMPPYEGGGDMIDRVTFEKTTWNVLPWKFEAGTPGIAGVVGMGAAIEFINRIGYDFIQSREKELLDTATDKISKVEGIRIVGTSKEKAGVLAFVSDRAHASDIGTLLDVQGIAIRTGHHCTQPLMDLFGVTATARASFSFYNTLEEIDNFIDALKGIMKLTS